MNTEPFSQNGEVIELCCEYLSVLYIWFYVVIIMSRRGLKVNLHSIVAWMWSNFCLETGVMFEVKLTVMGFDSTSI